jgi:hypothetical protein
VSSPIQGFRHFTKTAFNMSRAEQSSINRNKGMTVRLSERQHTEATDKTVGRVIFNPSQQFHCFATVAAVGGVIQNKSANPIAFIVSLEFF